MQVQRATKEEARKTKMQAGQIFVVYLEENRREYDALSRDQVARWEAKRLPKECSVPGRPWAIEKAEAIIRGAAA